MAEQSPLTESESPDLGDEWRTDLDIEFGLDNIDGDLQGLDCIEWYGMYGPECRGGGEDTIAYEKLRRL